MVYRYSNVAQKILKYQAVYPFLTEKYSDSEEQYYASYILCNLYYEPISAPS